MLKFFGRFSKRGLTIFFGSTFFFTATFGAGATFLPFPLGFPFTGYIK
jgi:hypothetical protein